MIELPLWERRFRAPVLSFPVWSRRAPDRLVVVSNESGAYQVYAWDRAARSRRQVTDSPIGVVSGFPTPDGEGVVWFEDTTGDEQGHWAVQPFAGGDSRPLVDGVPEAFSAGIALEPGVVVLGTAGDDGFAVHVSVDGGKAEQVHRHDETVDVADLSSDGRFAVLAHTEHGDTIHPALRAYDVRAWSPVGDLWDGEGFGLAAAGFSPVEGDPRLAVVHEREGRHRPAVWDVTTGERQDLTFDLPGEVEVVGWWPDASALLLLHSHEGRDWLLGWSFASGEVFPVHHPIGTISGAAVRPDDEVWFRVASGDLPATILSEMGDIVVAPDGEPAPGGRPFRSWHFENPRGDDVHGFVAEPEGAGPHPVVMLVHGGPTWAYSDTFLPDVQAWVDHGFVVGLVNYRGSTGYGMAWRDALVGDPGFPEVEDVLAGLDALVADGTVDPARAVLAGASWGGYITLLGIGLHPDRFAAALAGVPVADYVAAFEDEAPGLQAFDRTLFGGGPDDVRALYEERSPITYVDRVRTPVLILAGDNDSRCPIRQILNYVVRLEERGVDHDVYRYDAGHGSLVVDERVRQMRAELDFVLRHIEARYVTTTTPA